MRVRRAARVATAALTGSLLFPLGLPAAAAAAARPSDDSCPADAVPEDGFGDVAADSPHEAPIDCLVWWGVAKGVSATAYAPAGEVQRDQMATLVANLIDASGAVLPAPSRDHFTDDGDSVHEHNINRLAEAGVLGGTGDGRFSPGHSVDRAQTATYLVQAYDEVAEQAARAALPAGPDAFGDDNGNVHENNIDVAAAAGLAAGTGSGYAPLVAVRRDQIASFVTRALDLLVEHGMARTPAPRAGDLDPSYGQQGVVSVELGEGFDEGRAAALDGQGRLVVGGESSVRVDTGGFVQQVRVFTLTRLLPDGSLDPSFGADGTITGEPGDAFRVLSVAVQPDGKVLAGGFAVCGRMCTASVLARINADGTPDTSFGDGGRVRLEFDDTGPIHALAVDAGGRIVAGGQTRPIGSADVDDFSIVRYLPDGTLDPAFGEDGRVRTDFRAGSDVVSSIALHPDGSVVAGGTSHEPHQNAPVAPRFAVARYLADGTLDPAFGDAGTVEADLAPDASAREVLASVATTRDGGVVAAGHAAPDGVTPYVAVVRWAADGALDAAFGTAGVTRYEGAAASEASSVAVQDDGRIVVAGRAAAHPVPPGPADGPGQLGADTDWTWQLLRLTGAGALDPAFGDGGAVRTAVGKRAQAMVLQADGRIVAAGCSCPEHLSGPGGVETQSALVVARYLAEGTPERAGTIDRRFGDSGLSSVQVGDAYSDAFDAAVDGEGRVVLAGLSSRSVGLTRLLRKGDVDTAFGDGGTVVTPIGSAAEAHAVVVQRDGRIVVAGHTATGDGTAFALVRYLPDGALDASFGEGGVVTTAHAGYPDAKALGLLADGRLIAVGSAAVSGDLRNTGFLVARYLPDGGLDTSFDGDGLVTTDFRGGLDHAEALVVLADGRIVVGGTSNDPGGAQQSSVVLARYLEDGSLDPSFGDAGRVSADLGRGYDALGGLALQSDGALVAAADVDPYATAPLVVARFTADGALDPSFGTGGLTATDLAEPSRASDVTVAGDGRVLVAGVTGEDPDIAWVVVGYTADGVLDPSFGAGGLVRTAAGEHANALVLHGAGLLVAGCDCPELQFDRSGAESSSSFVAVRYLLSG